MSIGEDLDQSKRVLRRFTADELKLLQDDSLTNREIARRTGRSIDSIRLSRIHHGLAYPKDRGRRRWSTEEVEYLIEYAHLRDATLANALGRELSSVKSQKAALVAAGRLHHKQSPSAPDGITIGERTRRYAKADELIDQGLDAVTIAQQVNLSAIQVEDRISYRAWLKRRNTD